MNKIISIILTWCLFMTLSYAESGYKLPPENITKIFNTSPFPKIKFIQFEEIGLETTYRKYQTLEDISQPAVKLAGQDIIKRINAPSKSYPITSMKILNFKTGKEITVELPRDLKIRTYKFSFDNKKIAASYETEGSIKLLTIDVKTGKIKLMENILINDAFEDDGFWWMNDNRTILIKTIPVERGSELERPLIPESPIIEESSGKTSTERTYQHLLKDEYDEILFDYYFTSQLLLLNSRTNKLTKLGEPAIYDNIELSPNNNYLFISKIESPYSYHVPYYRFPKTFEIINLKGELVKHIFKRTLQDEVPIGGTYKGPRKFQWQPLKDATLIWVEALDEGNPKNKVDHRDKIMKLDAPFGKEPVEIFRTEHRYSNIDWSEIADEIFYSEYDRDRLWKRYWLYKVGDKSLELIFDLSTRDKYNNPGDLIKRTTKRGEKVFVKNGDTVYFKNNKGATPDGNYPYLAEFNLKTKEKKILFKCGENFHETISAFVGDSFDKIAIKSENKLTPPNYFFVDLKTGKREKITDYPNPYLELKDLKIELITYKRKDEIPLSGTLYLPVDYKEGERLPLIIGAYPVEFADSKTASQVDASPNRFISFWFDSVKYLTLHGYVVLSGASIPIVGDPETVNETFIEQTVSSIEAAINYLNERGIIDPKRVGIIGHSYGAFMVANILAHSDFCAAGVAKTGAYNRTLTPFGFQ
ncbi:MAG: prolyl oligopeptidase family serine peptidase, partial [Candidatus Cloacimonetes bacterium]|nr:prolyl oligopeptidase family serine peptidase [Candidatus Cloacimonadota bacterium]